MIVNNGVFPNENQEYTLNAMISFRSWEEYLKYKDRDMQEIIELMNERRKQQHEDLQNMLAERKVKQALHSDKTTKAIEEAIAKVVQEQLDKG